MKQKQKATLRFCLLFISFVLILFFLAHTQYAHRTVGKYYPAIIASIVAKFLKFSGFSVSVNGEVITSKSFSMDIIYHCSGIFATIIFISAVVAYPAKISKKIIGIIFGVPLLAFLNIFRLYIMFIIGMKFPKFFEFFHDFLWQIIFIIFVIYIWIFWIDHFVEKKS